MNQSPVVVPGPKARLRDIRKLHEKAGQFDRELRFQNVTMRPVKKEKGKLRSVEFGVQSRGFRQPAEVLGKAITEALDPSKAPGKVRTLSDMSSEEKAAIEKQYGAKIEASDRSQDLVLLPDGYVIIEETKKALRLAKGGNFCGWVSRSQVNVRPDGRIEARRWYARRKRLLDFHPSHPRSK